MKAGFLEKLIGRLGKIGPEENPELLLRLAQEKGFLETIFNTMQEGIIVTDSYGRITYLNDAACDFFGVDGEDSIGKLLGNVCEASIGMHSPKVVARSLETWKFSSEQSVH